MKEEDASMTIGLNKGDIANGLPKGPSQVTGPMLGIGQEVCRQFQDTGSCYYGNVCKHFHQVGGDCSVEMFVPSRNNTIVQLYSRLKVRIIFEGRNESRGA